MIEMRSFPHAICPVVVCDRCKSEISNVSLGAVVYLNRDSQGHSKELLFAHKQDCLDVAIAEGRDNVRWQELEYFLALLVNRAGMSPERMNELLNL
jgi:hypothetical protein